MNTNHIALALILALPSVSQATLYTQTYSGGNAVIPDHSTLGLTETLGVSGLADFSITQVILNFTLSGGLATDLTTAYLRLGNTITSPSFNLVPSLSGYTSLSTPATFNVDVSTSFVGQNPNNNWVIFFADSSSGAQTTLNGGWSLSIEAVPEPVNVALGIFAVLIGGASFQRWATRSVSAKNPAEM